MTKYFFIRKNTVIKCHETGKKGNYTRFWFRPKVSSDGWAEITTTSAVAQLEKDLKEKRLGLIPDKVIAQTREAWVEYQKNKPTNAFDEEIL